MKYLNFCFVVVSFLSLSAQAADCRDILKTRIEDDLQFTINELKSLQPLTKSATKAVVKTSQASEKDKAFFLRNLNLANRKAFLKITGSKPGHEPARTQTELVMIETIRCEDGSRFLFVSENP